MYPITYASLSKELICELCTECVIDLVQDKYVSLCLPCAETAGFTLCEFWWMGRKCVLLRLNQLLGINKEIHAYFKNKNVLQVPSECDHHISSSFLSRKKS